MARTVWKYPLKFQDFALDRGAVVMPRGAQVLTLQMQGDTPTLWALVDDEQTETETRVFRVAGTGHDLRPDETKYVGTFQLYGGSLVFHVFEVDSAAGWHVAPAQVVGAVA